MKVTITEMRKNICALLESVGISNEDALVVFSHLLEEELLGKSSHGFYRIPSIINAAKNLVSTERQIDIKETTEFATKILAANTLGLVAAKVASDIACKNAKKCDMSITSVTGFVGTTGALGYYARLFAKENLFAIIMCSSEYAVAPWGGKDAILGTNPIAIAIPNGDNPIISDFSTAAMTYGDLMLAAKENRGVPTGVVLDKDGNPSTDPMDADNGCQLPMAGHKGYALGLAVEILSGLFIGAKSGKDAVVGSDGVFIISFKPDLFVNQNEYTKNLSALINEILHSSLAPNSTQIRIPGGNCFNTISKGIETGYCEISDVVYNDIQNLLKEI